VEVGQKVNEKSIVCIVEAMKVMNELHADCTGTIAEILVENANGVEYGQPLFKIALT
jgi:acetyl-CoA carboxylase biotin carboxyl carrier protein